MKLNSENIYHIYNRGNNRQKIFFKPDNYIFFLLKMRKYLKPNLLLMAYCLMPNHFHFLVKTNNDFKAKNFSDSFKILLSSYTQAINVQENRTGSLFQQNSKAKCLSYESNTKKDENYGLICFNYIHQNPYLAGLVKKIEDWEFSSFPDYLGIRKGTICNIDETRKLLNIPIDKDAFYKMSDANIDRKDLENVY